MTAPTLLPPHRERLARLLGMLGSDHSGEALNAGRLADRLVRERGLRWDDVLAAPGPRQGPCDEWQAAAVEVLRSGLATDWEAQVCHTLLSRWSGREISQKQAAVLQRIFSSRCERKRA